MWIRSVLLSSDVVHAFSECLGISRRLVGYSFCLSLLRHAHCYGIEGKWRNTRSFGIQGHTLNSLATMQQHDYRLIAFYSLLTPLLLLDVNQIYLPPVTVFLSRASDTSCALVKRQHQFWQFEWLMNLSILYEILLLLANKSDPLVLVINPCYITPCLINPCFITPCFVNPCFVNPVHVLSHALFGSGSTEI